MRRPLKRPMRTSPVRTSNPSGPTRTSESSIRNRRNQRTGARMPTRCGCSIRRDEPPPNRGSDAGRMAMRVIPLVSALIVLLLQPIAAQEWIEYYSQTDRFLVNLPGRPTVRDITWRTEFGLDLPAHVHTYTDGKTTYSVTAVDYSDVQKIHAERV